ncbi:MAG TPA: SPOR domain-containing protein [Edaphobacter sp.]|nr:SPOR domain-containing protein [Edaphobacter sp.]
MNTRYENDLYESGEQDREISLSTTTILGIFFALALLCAVFFGFGYSMGRKSAQPVSSGSSEVTTRSENSNSKPAPGSPAGPSTPSVGRATDETPSSIRPLDSPNAASEDSTPPPTPVKAVVTSPRSNVPADVTPKPATKPAGIVPVAAALPSPGSSVVQVAAMSHQEDADVVAIDLKRRGYTVAVRHEPQDKLFHVQIGPFANKKEADAMRQRLQTDGYNNAIVK